MKKYRAWHFIGTDRRLGYDATDLTVEAGYVYSIGKDERPSICGCGMHGSIRALDALNRATGPIACRVNIWGDVALDTDELCGRHREVLAVVDATKLLHQFSCWCVRHTPLGDGRTVWDLLTDSRSRAAVEVKERWIECKATDAELAAAGAAAWTAAWAAAGAAAWAAAWAAGAAKAASDAWAAGAASNARAAARAAAWDAAWTAAGAAAWAAAWTAAGAAGAAAWDAQNNQLESMLLAEIEAQRCG